MFLSNTDNGAKVSEVLKDAKVKLWSASKSGDNELLTSVLKSLFDDANKCLDDKEVNAESEAELVNDVDYSTEDVMKLINESNEDGNSMLHLASFGGHLKVVW